MKERAYKILYLHGLESRLSDVKRQILENYAEVAAPDIDYKENLAVITSIFETYKDEKFDIIMGSSMGGFAGFYLAKALRIPALLFNPALPYRSVEQEIPHDLPKHHTNAVQMVLGAKDPIIKAADTLQFLSQNLPKQSKLLIHLRNDLEHRIPMKIFEEEVYSFFSQHNS